MKRKFFDGETDIFSSTAPRTPWGTVLRHGLWKQSGGPSQGRRLKHFCFVYTLAGECPYEDEIIGKRTMVPGDLLLIHPEIAHRYGNGAGGWDEYFILFEGLLFDLCREKQLLSPAEPIVHLEPISYWHQRMVACAEGEPRSDAASQLRQVVDLFSFMTDVICAQLVPDKATVHPWLADVRRRLETNLGDEIDWNALAQPFGLSFQTLRKVFTRVVGISPKRYRDAKIIDRACKLALNKNIRGKEIAFELGFANEQHFSRRFKEETGMTLQQFRRQWQPELLESATKLDKFSTPADK